MCVQEICYLGNTIRMNKPTIHSLVEIPACLLGACAAVHGMCTVLTLTELTGQQERQDEQTQERGGRACNRCTEWRHLTQVREIREDFLEKVMSKRRLNNL